MDYKKLFQVLVVGGAVVGGATACGDKPAEAAERPADAGTGGSKADAGTAGGGGGVQGW